LRLKPGVRADRSTYGSTTSGWLSGFDLPVVA
jgi:hypothetical protein